jgi:endonuclease-8
MTDSRTRFDNRLTALGPDILAPELDEAEFLRRLRSDDQTRGIGDALLDQRIIAGIGNIWKCEGCYMASVDPWRTVGDVSDDHVLAIVRAARPLMQLSVEQGRPVTWKPEIPARGGQNRHWVYNRDGRPCRNCDTIVQARPQGDDNRTTFWCPACQT